MRLLLDDERRMPDTVARKNRKQIAVESIERLTADRLGKFKEATVRDLAVEKIGVLDSRQLLAIVDKMAERQLDAIVIEPDDERYVLLAERIEQRRDILKERYKEEYDKSLKQSVRKYTKKDKRG